MPLLTTGDLPASMVHPTIAAEVARAKAEAEAPKVATAPGTSS